MNQVLHSSGGRLICNAEGNRVEVRAQDAGPGIEDVDAAVTEGFSTANDWVRSLGFGAGMGLPNVKRVSDEFTVQSAVGDGTTVVSVIYLNREEENAS
jgi:anti-sigma regulatory factor (Ser/Thr protein kinase)